ncbi:MAG: starvation-sensing protein RspA [Ruminococcaceae bacterium]|nr:starvation-sensing protein RspA [Oscillospiraceae bacterium]
MVTIRDIKAIETAPRGLDLVVVKVETSEPNLYGIGCATFTQRSSAVCAAVRDYLNPLFVGKSVNNIEDIWQTAMGSSYWRNGPVLNNALSGLDQALWDIKGKMANMPVYELLGGKCREGAAVYVYCDGNTFEEVEENVRKRMDEGYRFLRCQMSQMGKGKQTIVKPENAPEGAYYDPKQYMRDVVRMFAHLREKIGYEIELLHDVHERISGIDSLQLAKDLEPFRLFFLEDSFAPEHVDWFKLIRQQTSTPIAMGELFNNPLEWRELIINKYIDFIRVHLSQIGGLTPAIKLAHFCGVFGVRTAWHGPSDITPVGVAAHLHLDLVIPNFGIQEFAGFTDAEREIFSGAPEVRNGYLYANDKPGFGIEFNERLAMKYPCEHRIQEWVLARLPDGTAVRP